MSSTASEAGESTTAAVVEDEGRDEIMTDAASDDDADEKTTFLTVFGKGEFIDPAQAAELFKQQTKDSSSSSSLSLYHIDLSLGMSQLRAAHLAKRFASYPRR